MRTITSAGPNGASDATSTPGTIRQAPASASRSGVYAEEFVSELANETVSGVSGWVRPAHSNRNAATEERGVGVAADLDDADGRKGRHRRSDQVRSCRHGEELHRAVRREAGEHEVEDEREEQHGDRQVGGRHDRDQRIDVFDEDQAAADHDPRRQDRTDRHGDQVDAVALIQPTAPRLERQRQYHRERESDDDVGEPTRDVEIGRPVDHRVRVEEHDPQTAEGEGDPVHGRHGVGLATDDEGEHADHTDGDAPRLPADCVEGDAADDERDSTGCEQPWCVSKGSVHADGSSNVVGAGRDARSDRDTPGGMVGSGLPHPVSVRFSRFRRNFSKFLRSRDMPSTSMGIAGRPRGATV